MSPALPHAALPLLQPATAAHFALLPVVLSLVLWACSQENFDDMLSKDVDNSGFGVKDNGEVCKSGLHNGHTIPSR